MISRFSRVGKKNGEDLSKEIPTWAMWLFTARIGTQDFDGVAFALEQLNGLGNLGVFHVTIDINEEEILPGLALARGVIRSWSC